MEQPPPELVLKALAEGMDPVTGDALPSSPILQHAIVRSALQAAIAALEAQAARAHKSAPRPGNIGQPWTTGEEQRLADAFRGGEPPAAIAERHGRSLTAIEARLERMGLLAPEARITRNRYVSGDARERR